MADKNVNNATKMSKFTSSQSQKCVNKSNIYTVYELKYYKAPIKSINIC